MNNLKEKRSAMRAVVEDWQSSGKSKKQYCLEKGINAAKFYYWHSKINDTERIPRGFIPIEKTSATREIELVYPNGVRLKVDNDLLLLSQLIHLY